MAAIRIRLAREDDAAALLAVYAPYVRDTAISFEMEPPSESEFCQRIATTLAQGAWLVCEAGDRVLGYAYGARFHSRLAYQWSVEVTVYVDSTAHRRGVGRGLYTSLLGCVALQGFRTAVGVIALPNPASVGLHEHLGFTCAGVVRNVGYKFGRWHDVGWWQRALGPHDGSPPPPLPAGAVATDPAWQRALESGAALVR